ncbi:uncharacterized protein [Littorina saxatilis]|uniref:Uncharacterized protein n=1 Tax=Littorina saxatilis TaxID=31220 RepID=A0AAN9API4_9CAEN
MERLMILLVVVAVTLSTVLSCPLDEIAMRKEILMCTAARENVARQNIADSEQQGKSKKCLATPHMLTCIDTVMTDCEGVPYVEAKRAELDADVQRLNEMYQQMCV